MAATHLSDHHRLTTKHPHLSLNGTEMKKLGISNIVRLLTVVADLWAWTNASPSGGKTRQQAGSQHQDHPERGDVPGWVMITLMSAVLVAALLALAGPALETMFNQAMDKVGK